MVIVKLFKNYFLSERQPGIIINDLNLNLNPKISINYLKNYKFKSNEILHYSFLTIFLIISYSIVPITIWIKFPIVLLFILSLLIPFTSQFLLNALPILTWVAFFFTSPNISSKFKPPISVKVLPAMETILYGDNLSELLAASTNSILDILAWLPYGLIHFALPFIVAILLFLWGPPTCLRSFAFAFGYMNLFGVIIQLLFPAAPPWYKILHGLNPANYSMLGSPGGLARIDQLLHLDLYTTNFSKNSPVVFGAFPSLHSGSATMDALFLSYLFPKFTPLFIIYVCWLWWSTMYLTHHYFIDLMAGSLLSLIVFTYTKYIHLPINEELKNRWSYVEIKKINIFKLDPLKLSLDDEIDNNNNINRGSSRLRSGSIQQYQYELNIISRTSNNNDDTIINNNDDDGVSSPENSSVFENDIPRSFSRASNTSLESQYDLGTYPSKSRID